MTAHPRPLSAAALTALVAQVKKTGCAATVKANDVVIVITPPAKDKPVNPADLIEP